MRIERVFAQNLPRKGSTLMNDIFISYARADQGFVRELYAMLRDANRDPWVDWEGIPPSAQWLQEVYDAIEAADTFVFVLSPHSLASRVCMLEVNHAQQFKKRIIPVVYQDVSSDQVPTVLREINWVYFRASDDREDAFTKLEFALDTNLRFWKLSASLLVRARQWEVKRKGRSLVLRGEELIEAEHWLAEGVNIQPTPTSLQIEFINASRRAATQRQRTITGVFAAATSVLLILSIISLLLFQNATTQQRIATQQRDAALARQLALESGVALNQGALDLALLLSAQATKIDANIQTRDALLDALVDSPHIQTMYHASNGLVTAVAVSPDGKTLYGIGSALFAWNLADPSHPAKILALPSDLTGSRPASISSLLVSHDGTRLAVVAPQRLSLVDTTTGTIVQKFEQNDINYEFAVAFSQDDTRVSLAYTYEFDPNGSQQQSRIQVRQYDTRTASMVGSPFDIVFGSNQPFVFSHDGTQLAIGTCAGNVPHCANGQINIWNIPKRHLARTLSIGSGGATAIAFSKDDSLLAIGACTLDNLTGAFRCNHGNIEVWSPASGIKKYSAQVRNELGDVVGFAFSPNGRYLISSLIFGECSGFNCNQGQMQLWAVHGLQMIGEPFAGHLPEVGNMVFLPDGEHIVTPGNADAAYEWRIRGYDPISSYIVLPDEQRAIVDSFPVYSSSGTSLIMRNGQDIYTWDPTTGAVMDRVPIAGTGFVTLSVDGSLAAECETDTLLWDVVGKKLTRSLADNQDTGPCQSAAFSSDGKYLAASFLDLNTGHSSIVIWDVATGETLQRIVIASALDIQLAFGMDSKFLAVLSDHAALTLWSRVTEGEFANPVRIPQAVRSFIFGFGGKTFAVVQKDGLISFYETRTLKKPSSGVPATSQGVGNLLALTPDDHYMATFGYYTLTIWDVTQHAPYVHFPHTGPDTLGATFSRDGRYLSWDDSDGIIITRSLHVADWQRTACSIASRDLTKAEWARYVGTIPYVTTCLDTST